MLKSRLPFGKLQIDSLYAILALWTAPVAFCIVGAEPPSEMSDSLVFLCLHLTQAFAMGLVESALVVQRLYAAYLPDAYSLVGLWRSARPSIMRVQAHGVDPLPLVTESCPSSDVVVEIVDLLRLDWASLPLAMVVMVNED